jgi:hypothetical protein
MARGRFANIETRINKIIKYPGSLGSALVVMEATG